MKLAKVRIENFRRIESLELDFTDELGRVRDLVLLVGPNTCGKTTILDAIAAALGRLSEIPALRPGLELIPRRIVRPGAVHARVTCWVRFTAEEIAAAREIMNLLDPPKPIPDVPEVEVCWTYPDPREHHRFGHLHCTPFEGWNLFKARVSLARLFSTRRLADVDWFKRAGAVFTFDQQRKGLEKSVRQDIWEIIQGGPARLSDSEESERRTSDPRYILLSLAIQSMLRPANGDGAGENGFSEIKRLYEQICHPHQLLGAVREDVGGADLLFSDGRNQYRYDDASSGEQMVLLFLIRFVSERIHQSIVLLDEIELHQHPVWQRKLLHLLPRMGVSNQIIATTHSSYVRDVAPPEAVVSLGALGDGPLPEGRPAWQSST